MIYQSLKDLPDGVQNVLPLKAREIYLAAFNNAWKQYQKPKDRYGDDSRETVAHKVAWSAVKQKYTKDGDHWKKKPDQATE